MRKDLEKYRTEDWSILEYDTDRTMHRAKMMRVRFGFLGLIALALMAAVQVF